MMKPALAASLSLLALAAALPPSAVAVPAAADPTIRLAPEAIVVITPDKGVSRSAFEAGSGQIDILVHKDQFPLAAPSCRHDVMARVPETELGKTVGKEELARRWNFLQKVRADYENHRPIELTLISRPYLKTGRDGSPELPYCSAVFQVR